MKKLLTAMLFSTTIAANVPIVIACGSKEFVPQPQQEEINDTGANRPTDQEKSKYKYNEGGSPVDDKNTLKTMFSHSEYVPTKYAINQGDIIVARYTKFEKNIIRPKFTIGYYGAFEKLNKKNNQKTDKATYLKTISLVNDVNIKVGQSITVTFQSAIYGFLLVSNIVDFSGKIEIISVNGKKEPENVMPFYKIGDGNSKTFLTNILNADSESKNKISRAAFFEGEHIYFAWKIKSLQIALNKNLDLLNLDLDKVLGIMDKFMDDTNDVYGFSYKSKNDYFVKSNYKVAAWENDIGAGSAYATENYISTHSSSWVSDYFLSEKFLEPDPVGFSLWGLWHEVGHTYQLPQVKLNWWTEVTVNVASYQVMLRTNKFNEENLKDLSWWKLYYGGNNPDKWKDFLTYFKDKQMKLTANEKEIKKFIDTYNKTNSNKYKVDINEFGLLFWIKLINMFGSDFSGALHNYYMLQGDELFDSKLPMQKRDNIYRMDRLIYAITSITGINLTNYWNSWGFNEFSDETQKLLKNSDNDQSNAKDLFVNHENYIKWEKKQIGNKDNIELFKTANDRIEIEKTNFVEYNIPENKKNVYVIENRKDDFDLDYLFRYKYVKRQLNNAGKSEIVSLIFNKNDDKQEPDLSIILNSFDNNPKNDFTILMTFKNQEVSFKFTSIKQYFYYSLGTTEMMNIVTLPKIDDPTKLPERFIFSGYTSIELLREELITKNYGEEYWNDKKMVIDFGILLQKTRLYYKQGNQKWSSILKQLVRIEWNEKLKKFDIVWQ